MGSIISLITKEDEALLRNGIRVVRVFVALRKRVCIEFGRRAWSVFVGDLVANRILWVQSPLHVRSLRRLALLANAREAATELAPTRVFLLRACLDLELHD